MQYEMIKYISQPDNSYCCGQCCIAMAASVDLEDVFRVIGRKGTTKTNHLHKALKHYGINDTQKNRLTPIRGDMSKLPYVAILKVKMAWEKRYFHWVFKFGDIIFDPGPTGVVSLMDYLRIKDFEISSYLKINYSN